MSRRRVQRFVLNTYGIEVSLDVISNVERRVTGGLAAPHAEAVASVVKSPTKHLIGGEPTWVTTSDRSSSYGLVDLDGRQVCLAHLVRKHRLYRADRQLRFYGFELDVDTAPRVALDGAPSSTPRAASPGSTPRWSASDRPRSSCSA